METPAPLTKEQKQAVRTALAGRYEAAETLEVLEDRKLKADKNNPCHLAPPFPARWKPSW